MSIFYKDWKSRLKLLCIQIVKCLMLPVFFISLLYISNSLSTFSVDALQSKIAIKCTIPLRQEKYWIWNGVIGKEVPVLLIIIFLYRLRSVSRLIIYKTPVSYLHSFTRSLTIAHDLKSDPLQRDELIHSEISSLFPTDLYYTCACLPPMYCLLYWIYKVIVPFKQLIGDLLWRK